MTILEKIGCTRGPWEHEQTEKTENRLDELILAKNATGTWVGWAYDKANANLMAAAPAMFEALVNIGIYGALKHEEDWQKIKYIIEASTGNRYTWEQIKEMMEENNDN